MKYDLTQQSEIERARERFNSLVNKGKGILEITLVSEKRTLKQNAYLHVILSLFACQYGESEEYVKQQYFKRIVNPRIFISHKWDKLQQRAVAYLRSTSELSKDELQEAIERFRNWSSMNAGIYLPSSEEHRLLQLAQIEIERNKTYL